MVKFTPLHKRTIGSSEYFGATTGNQFFIAKTEGDEYYDGLIAVTYFTTDSYATYYTAMQDPTSVEFAATFNPQIDFTFIFNNI